MWLDTHCHLDAPEFDADVDAVVARALQAGVDSMILPAVHGSQFARVRALAHRYGFAYCLGLHPLYVHGVDDSDIDLLDRSIRDALGDPHFVGVGEIGLDYFDPSAPSREHQEWVFARQLKLAVDHGLPVVLHVRRSADRLLYHTRRAGCRQGIVHAFNGSEQQAQDWLEQGFCLGFGGASTYEGSLRIRRLAGGLPESALVLETDAPDISPVWLRLPGSVQRNEPAELPRVAAAIAGQRSMPVQRLAEVARANAQRVIPRLSSVPARGGNDPERLTT